MREMPHSINGDLDLIRTLLIDKQGHVEEAARLEQLCLLMRVEISRDDILLWPELMLNMPPTQEHDQCIYADVEAHTSFPSLLDEFLHYLISRCFSGVPAQIARLATTHTQDSYLRADDSLSLSQELLNAFCQRMERVVILRAFSFIAGHIQVPQVRQKVFLLGFEVVNSVEHKAYSQSLAEALSNFLLLSASDIWSAIRKDAARQIVTLSESKTPFYTAKDVDKLLSGLLSMASAPEESCEAKKTAWRSKHGALMMLCNLLRCIRVTELSVQNQIGAMKVCQSIKGKNAAVRHTHLLYSFGSNIFFPRHLPSSLIVLGKKVLYRCLLHEQQDVREQAANALSLYIKLCDDTTRVITFQELVSKLHIMNTDKLNEATLVDQPTQNVSLSYRDLSDQIVPKLLDCHVAEGYLNALVQVIPSLTCEFLLRHWDFINSTLDRYVMHVASSVRQKASLIIDALIHKAVKEIDTPDDKIIDGPALALTLLIQILTTLKDGNAQPFQDSCSWQGKEGRLLCIEVITNILGRDLLLGVEYPNSNLLATPHEKCPHRWNKAGRLRPLYADQDLKLWQWAHEEPHYATWLISDRKECIEWQQNHIAHRNTDNGRRLTIVDLLNLHLKQEGFETDACYKPFWRKVFTGFLHQTMCCCDFKQFELQRMIKQTLGGLVRMLLWLELCDEPNKDDGCCIDLLKEELLASGNQQMIRWVVRFLCFHIRYLQEHLATEDQDEATTTHIITHLISKANALVNELTTTITNVDLFDSSSSTDSEAWVMALQALIAAFIVLPKQQIHESLFVLVQQALDIISICQTCDLALKGEFGPHCKTISLSIQCNQSSLDRISSISLVRMIPSFVIAYTGKVPEVGAELSSERPWRLLRIISSWLLSDDSLRWITISRTDAHWYLLEGLQMLFVPPHLEEKHQDFMQCCLTVTEEFCKNSRNLNTIAVHQLCKICETIWTYQNCSVQSRVLSILVSIWLHTERNRTGGESSVWADWDEEEAGTVTNTDTKVSMPGDKEVLNATFESIRALGHEHLAQLLSNMQESLTQDFTKTCLGMPADGDGIDEVSLL
uniref:Uncharacterized protein AlNc14C36G3165 n=1 Tax=Albugo laibachii Nc14 TaxID=890382 RepID=F0W8N9_9STRA|nr:hypothetical protein PITG_00928 [Albugo laibachii Nc14]|eukprot:CCA17496.1 hypothetical protein PITG_00928 [Albugo laibachii Nc14]